MRFSIIFFCLTLGISAQQPPAPQFRPGKPGRRTNRRISGLGPAPDSAAAKLGEPVFETKLRFCHGPAARGAEGPNLLQSTLVLHDEKGESIGKVVHAGRPDRGMPAFPSLTETQIYDIAEFIHEEVYSAANRGTYKVLNILTGDPAAGEAYSIAIAILAILRRATSRISHQIAASRLPHKRSLSRFDGRAHARRGCGDVAG